MDKFDRSDRSFRFPRGRAPPPTTILSLDHCALGLAKLTLQEDDLEHRALGVAKLTLQPDKCEPLALGVLDFRILVC